MLPITGKFLILGLLGMVWVALSRYAMRVEAGEPFHLATYQRDRRKARFYYLSIWAGLTAAFVSFTCLEAVASVSFDSPAEREWVFNLLRGLGLWGLVIIAMVWSQVGQRVSHINSDGKALLPTPEKLDKK